MRKLFELLSLRVETFSELIIICFLGGWLCIMMIFGIIALLIVVIIGIIVISFEATMNLLKHLRRKLRQRKKVVKVRRKR